MRLLIKSGVDWATIKTWILTCESKHGNTYETQGSGKLDIPGLKVIDCERCAIIPAPKKCAYTALSYVWGQTADNSESSSTYLR